MLLLAAVTAIVGALVVDGTGAAPRKVNVVIDGERILALSQEIPAGATIISADNHTLTPGFFDLHTHLSYSAVSGLTGDWGKNLKSYLYCGVTTVADFGTYPETFEPMRRLIASGTVAGPRLHLAARITTPGGHGAEGGRGDFFSLEVTTPDEARAATRRWLAYKPDAIKVFTDGWRYGSEPDMTSMDEDTLKAIVDLAHKQNVEVMTHTVTLDRAKIAARAGVDVIAHGIGDKAADAELVKLLRERKTAYVPTLAVYEYKSGPLAPLLRDVLEPAALKRVDRPDRGARGPTASRRKRWENLMVNIATLRAGGARIATGTDAGVTGAYHGYSTLRELELLVAGGLTPLEALTAATGDAAKAIHVDGERGTIEPGKLADLVLIEGAPHENINDVERVRRVWLGGREVPRDKLKAGIAHPGVTPIPARKAVALIDDLEHDRTSLDTLRVNSTDEGTNHSAMLFQRVPRAGGQGHVLAIQARMSIKKSPYAQLWLPLSKGAVEPVDVSAFKLVRFDVRGEGAYSLVFWPRAIRSYNLPKAPFEAAGDWRTVQAPLPANARELISLGFEIARPAGEMGWLEIDNVRFQ
ncbi:MAG: amidohydrolase family protein [Bryobacterales bacterium]|nr:amidohydrolase family protein [Bryobacterales bacterium]